MFGVIVTRKQSIPAQGHGYPPYIMEYNELIQFPSEETLMVWVRRNDSYTKPEVYQLIKFEILSIDKTVSYKIH